jgi:hypothetical protein
MTTLFWKDALASLPPNVQRRHAASFEAAERLDALLDLGIEAWGSVKHALAKICQAAARAMRGTARILDGAAHRLLPDALSRDILTKQKSPGFVRGLFVHVDQASKGVGSRTPCVR